MVDKAINALFWAMIVLNLVLAVLHKHMGDTQESNSALLAVIVIYLIFIERESKP